MRLKGGMLLLDFSFKNIDDEPTLRLSKKEVDCALSKGLVIKFTNGDVTLTKEVIFNQLPDETTLKQHDFFTDDTNQAIYDFVLNLNSGIALIVTQ